MFEDFEEYDGIISDTEETEYSSFNKKSVSTGLLDPKFSNFCIGHRDKEEILLGWINNNTLPHALIFTGPVGIGKATFSYRLARALFKKGEGEGQNSFFCNEDSFLNTLDVSPEDSVFAKMVSGGHPDFLPLEYSLDPKKEGKKAEIDVYTARKVSPFLRMTASDGGWRIVIIDNADTMNRNAQNAVLKILEEPPKKSLLILIVHRLGAMIPTIRSRCRILQFHELKENDFDELLNREIGDEFSESEKNILCFLGCGSIGVVKNIINTNGIEIIKEIINILEDWPHLNWVAIHRLGERFSKASGDMKGFPVFSYSINCIFEALIRIKATGEKESVLLPISEQTKYKILSQYSLEELSEICEKIREHLKQADVSNLDKYQAVLGCFAIITVGE